MSGPTPLLDFFKRGEAARDVRMLAAQGTLAPRAHEQLAILVLLLDDPDPEIRSTADQTLNKIPEDALKGFLARSDVQLETRQFFADRGIFPAEIPLIEADDPLIDTAPEEADVLTTTMSKPRARGHCSAAGEDVVPRAAEGSGQGLPRSARDPRPRSEQDDLVGCSQ